MTIYVLMLIVVIMCCFLEINSSNLVYYKVKIDTRKLSFWTCFVFIFLLGILRDELLGVDVENYKIYFTSWYKSYDFTDIIKNFGQDNGYILINKIVEMLTHDFYIFKIIAYTFVFGLFSIQIYKKSKYPALSFLVYIGLGFLNVNFCLLRQAFAYAICFFAFKYFENGKKIKFLLLVILAATFHKTAIFFALIYPFVFLGLKRISIYKKTIFIFGCILFSDFFIPSLFKFYTNDYSDLAEKGQGVSLLVFYIVIITFMSIMKKDGNNKILEEDNLEYEASFCTIYFQISSLFFSLFTRVTNYYALLFTISIPSLLEKTKNKKLYYWTFVCAFSFLYILNLYLDLCNIVPYISNLK